MNSEHCRLRSFDNWYNSGPAMYSRALAANGFFATGNSFEVECNWCHCRISDWTIIENIQERHMSMSPNCDFIVKRQGCDNLPLAPELQLVHGSEENAYDSGFAGKANSTLDLLIEKDRLSTFVNWPVRHAA